MYTHICTHAYAHTPHVCTHTHTHFKHPSWSLFFHFSLLPETRVNPVFILGLFCSTSRLTIFALAFSSRAEPTLVLISEDLRAPRIQSCNSFSAPTISCHPSSSPFSQLFSFVSWTNVQAVTGKVTHCWRKDTIKASTRPEGDACCKTW